MAIINSNTPVGFEASGHVKTITPKKLNYFSGGFPMSIADWPRTNIHTSSEFAQKCGLPAQIASGAMFEGYIAELMIDLFGDEWLKNGEMSVKFIKKVFSGEKVVTKSLVRSRASEGNIIKIIMDIWCENQHGEKVVVGTAQGSIGRLENE